MLYLFPIFLSRSLHCGSFVNVSWGSIHQSPASACSILKSSVITKGSNTVVEALEKQPFPWDIVNSQQWIDITLSLSCIICLMSNCTSILNKIWCLWHLPSAFPYSNSVSQSICICTSQYPKIGICVEPPVDVIPVHCHQKASIITIISIFKAWMIMFSSSPIVLRLDHYQVYLRVKEFRQLLISYFFIWSFRLYHLWKIKIYLFSSRELPIPVVIDNTAKLWKDFKRLSVL